MVETLHPRICERSTRACTVMNISPQTAAADPGDEQMDGFAPLESRATPQKTFSSAAAAANLRKRPRVPESAGPKPPARR